MYELNEPQDESANFVKVVARLMEVEYLSVIVDKTKDTEIVQKSLTGKFPILELPDKTCLSEGLSIARYLSADKYGFYGPDSSQKAQIDQWIDITSSQVAPQAHNLVQQVTGFAESEIKAFSKSLSAFKQNLTLIEKHLKLRNYLVGYQLTLADVWLIVNLIAPYQLFIDKKTRD